MMNEEKSDRTVSGAAKTMRSRLIGLLFFILAGAFLTGCGRTSSGANIRKAPITNGGVTGDTVSKEETGTELYVVRELDTLKESLTVISLQTGNQLRFDYKSGTEFFDRYGNYEVWSKFIPGTLVTLGTVKTDSTVSSVSMYDKGFRYDNISDFSLDTSNDLISFAKEKYLLSDKISVFSDDELLSVDDIRAGDVLSVIGEGREVYCLVVTASNGTIKLTHTEKFDGSVIEIGGKIFAEVERNIRIDVPEGTYTVTVANNGYGGSCEVTVTGGAETSLDLSTLEGEGPKTCRLRFSVQNPDCRIFLDGKKVDNFSTVSVVYGTHTLVISADGYDTWKKYLLVNSETAEISVGLDEADESGSSSTADTADAAMDEGITTTDGTLPGGTGNTIPGTGNTGTVTPATGNTAGVGTGATSLDTAATDLEYYSTLSNLISTLLR